ncbi:MAG: mechanosensitive ion channel domain-containing protein, partial [Gammaproteobacteria bacterium]
VETVQIAMKIIPSRLPVILFTLIFTLPSTLSAADEAPTLKEIVEKSDVTKIVDKPDKKPAKGPADEYGRTTPRSSTLGLAKALSEMDFDTAVHYMDFRNLPFSIDKVDGPDLARKLLIIADRSMVIDWEAISDDPDGHSDDGLPKYRDRITTIKTSQGLVDILMQKAPRGDGVSIWKLSNATIAMIPELNKEFGYGPIGDKLSLIFPNYYVMGLELWQWGMVIVLIGMGWIIAYVATWIVFQTVKLYRKERFETVQKFINGPLRLLILVLFFRATFDLIAPTLVARAFFEARTLLILALVWVSLGVVDLIMYRIAERIKKRGNADAVVLLRPATTAIKLTLIFIGAVSWLDNIGYEVTTLLAGLGVGGIAVAFAAQRTLENLIGSITIYSSQPVHVGDFCKFGDTLGVVEEIGLRATQLRTLERTVVHIPNAKFSTDVIENLTQRDKILYRTRLRLSLQTTASQMQQVLKDIRELIDQHAMIDEEASRVRFLEFGEYAQEIELYVYIKTRDFAEYLEYREDINLSIQGIIETAGTQLVVPTRTTYLEGSTSPSST